MKQKVELKFPNWKVGDNMVVNKEFGRAVRYYTRLEFEYDIKAPTVPYGGYTLHFIMADGSAMSYEAAKENKKLICAAIDERAAGEKHGDTQWLVVAKEVNWEDNDLKCVHSGKLIPANYPNGQHE